MTSAEYLRELRSDEALRLLTSWAQQMVARGVKPHFTHPVATVDLYRERRLLFFKRTMARVIARPVKFMQLPNSGGSLYLAQNLMLAVYIGEEVVAPDPALSFKEECWTIMDVDDSGTPMEVLDHVVSTLRPLV